MRNSWKLFSLVAAGIVLAAPVSASQPAKKPVYIPPIPVQGQGGGGAGAGTMSGSGPYGNPAVQNFGTNIRDLTGNPNPLAPPQEPPPAIIKPQSCTRDEELANFAIVNELNVKDAEERKACAGQSYKYLKVVGKFLDKCTGYTTQIRKCEFVP